MRSCIAGPVPRYGTWVTSTPIATLSKTQLTCVAEPPPAEPYCIRAWLALAYAVNSDSVLAGKSLRVTSTFEFSTNTATGAKSLTASYGGFLVSSWL